MSDCALPPAEDGCVWREIGYLETSCGTEDFLSGVEVWLKRPQVVNRRLLGAVLVEGDWDVGGSESVRTTSEARERVFVRELLPRAKSVETRNEAVTIRHDSLKVSVTFAPVDDVMSIKSGCGSYRLEYSSGDPQKVSLSIFGPLNKDDGSGEDTAHYPPDGVTTPTLEWLYSVLLRKVVQWSEESERRGREASSSSRQHESLVPLASYSSLYRHLRDKYGPPLIQNWPEATDPHKFVYEDIAIATYLILLWEKEREERGLTKKQTFIDLGCGNGLLVYLLTSEGYTGKGIDLRRRKIWGYYGDRADLEVVSLTPSDLTVFPQFDWLIGNHSDELTPWIPLMAARSSYQTRYFVLPCCPHDFDSKFRRPDTTKSQYSSYLDYIRLIGETVGFRVQEDTLRIPSSKRVCQVGQRRWYAEEDEEEMEKKRESFLRERCRSGLPRQSGGEGGDGEGVVTEGGGVVKVGSENDKCTKQVNSVASGRCGGSGWSERFVPRSATDQTRNCLHVDRSLQEFIVQTLASHLLETENWIAIPTTPAVISSSTPTSTASSTTNIPSSATTVSSSTSTSGASIPSPVTALRSPTNTVPSHCSSIISSHPSAASSTSESLATSTSNKPTNTNSVSTSRSVLTSLPTLTTAPLGSPATNTSTSGNPRTASESNPLPAALPILTTAAEKTPGDNVARDTHTDAALSSMTAALSSKSHAPSPNTCQSPRKTPCDGSSRLPHTPKTTSKNICDDVIPINDVDDVVGNLGNRDDAARQKKFGMEGEEREMTATGGKHEARLTCEGSQGNQSLWNLGGRLSLSDAARLFDDAVLRQLKQECGGLQTLLRNHHQVFAVSRGFVQLRNWAVAGPEHGPRRPAKRRSAEDAKRLVKTKPCWFHHNHPQGCPRRFLEDSSCPYAHSSGDLRQRPDFSSTSEREVTFPTLTT